MKLEHENGTEHNLFNNVKIIYMALAHVWRVYVIYVAIKKYQYTF